MDNTTYEFFIRRCWDCDRFKNGANTDTWEDLLSKHHHFKNANVGNFKYTQQEFEKQLLKVKTYIDKAFNKLILKSNKKKANPAVIQEFLKLQAVAANSSEPQEIFDALRVAFPLMNDNNL